MLRLELITKDNIDIAIKIENKIFPLYNAKNNYYDSLENDRVNFFLVYDNDIIVGISGVYSYKEDHDNAWLGFFGIKEEYRNKKYGKKTLLLSEEYAKKLNFKFMRLLTDKFDNDYAIEFYERNGYTFEDYDSDLEPLKEKFKVVIGSKALGDIEPDKWDNRFINLSKQTIKQQY